MDGEGEPIVTTRRTREPAGERTARRDAPGAETSTSRTAPRLARRDAAQVIESVAGLARPIVESLGAEIDRIEYRETGRRALLQVFIDRQPGGVNLDDIVETTRQLSAVLDVHDVVPRAFTMEVSSPGLDRPLSGEADFRRFAGRLASFTCRQAVEGGSKVLGILRGVEDGQVVVEAQDGGPRTRIVRIPLDMVAKARLEVSEADQAGDGPLASGGGEG